MRVSDAGWGGEVLQAKSRIGRSRPQILQAMCLQNANHLTYHYKCRSDGNTSGWFFPKCKMGAAMLRWRKGIIP